MAAVHQARLCSLFGFSNADSHGARLQRLRVDRLRRVSNTVKFHPQFFQRLLQSFVGR